MFLFMIFLALFITGTLVALFREVRMDGYGSRPAPRSHYDELDPRFAH